MARITLIGPLKDATTGAPTFEVDVADVRSLLQAIAARYPDLAPLLEQGVAIAIDGEIFQDDWLAPIKPDSEVQVLPPLAGG